MVEKKEWKRSDEKTYYIASTNQFTLADTRRQFFSDPESPIVSLGPAFLQSD